MEKYKAEVQMDAQHGPIVRVMVGNEVVDVYLAFKTAIVRNDKGQAGLEVKGPWTMFNHGLRAIVESEKQ